MGRLICYGCEDNLPLSASGLHKFGATYLHCLDWKVRCKEFGVQFTPPYMRKADPVFSEEINAV